jgi:DNA-binding HxlR family transcriptional regulator
VRVSYVLTEVGRQFGEVSDAVTRWGKLIIDQSETVAPPKKRRRAG